MSAGFQSDQTTLRDGSGKVTDIIPGLRTALDTFAAAPVVQDPPKFMVAGAEGTDEYRLRTGRAKDRVNEAMQALADLAQALTECAATYQAADQQASSTVNASEQTA